MQLGNDYTVFLSSIEYSEDEKLVLKLDGHKLGEEIDTKTFDLAHLNEDFTFDVSFISL